MYGKIKTGDGLQSPNELPVSGVTLTLYASDGSTVATAITNGNGEYVFDNVLLGDYTVGFGTFPINHYLTTQDVGTNDSLDSDVSTVTFQSGTYTVIEGVRIEGADAGLVLPVANIGDFVWLDSNKNGLQDAGEPGVAGVTVTLYNNTGVSIKVVKTDATGTLSIYRHYSKYL